MSVPRRVVVEAVWPSTPDGVSAAKALKGRPFMVSATVFADGHDVVRALVRWQGEAVEMVDVGNDRFEATVEACDLGAHQFHVEGWVDPIATWRAHVVAKRNAGQDVAGELDEGALLIEAELDRIPIADAATTRDTIDALRAGDEAAAVAFEPPLLPHRTQTTVSGPWSVWVDRARAAVGSWYELFPRSYGGFRGTVGQLDRIGAMGFDVLYLPPIHPIGTTARKGPGNVVGARRGDPGSPWAIGSSEGGHDAIDPGLGTVEDFTHLVQEAKRRGIEVALDFALQCSPDHPWVTQHPEWFLHRPDGSIRYAENPPKRYEDIFPIDFFPPDDRDRIALWTECRRLVELWIERGVRIFRVDNPHTKPIALWRWLIDSIHATHPDVVFLAEAFTRPAMMQRLAEIGFSQSYTYFTWRTSKAELTEYGDELARGPASAYFRPNLWPNTPDILSGPLRNGPPAAFRIRAVLAATLGPSWGIYSGYELCENTPASDTNEEYAHSEKYELRTRNWDDPASIAPFVARLNECRNAHRALADLASLHFHHATSDDVIAYSKRLGDDVVLVVVNLHPFETRDAALWIDLGALGLPWDEPLRAVDELSGEDFAWRGPEPYVRIDPERTAHVIALSRR